MQGIGVSPHQQRILCTGVNQAFQACTLPLRARRCLMVTQRATRGDSNPGFSHLRHDQCPTATSRGCRNSTPVKAWGSSRTLGGELRLIRTPPPSTQVNLHHTLQRWEDQPLGLSPHQCFSLTNFTHQPGTPTNTTRCLQCKRLAAR